MSHTKLQVFLGFLFLLAVACFTAYYAKRQGRNPYLWFMAGILLGIFAPLILFYLSTIKNGGNANGMPAMTVSKPDPSLENREEALPTKEDQMLKEEEDKLWYYLDQSHHQMGPVSIIALRELWNRGQLSLNTYVWSEGMKEWQKVDALTELKALLNKI